MKESAKLFVDGERGARKSDVKARDTVFLSKESANKLTPYTFKPEPHRVVNKTESSVVFESPDGIQYRRNSSHVNKFLARVIFMRQCLLLVFRNSMRRNHWSIGDGDNQALKDAGMHLIARETAEAEPRRIYRSQAYQE